MMNMMTTTGGGMGLPLFFGLHMLFGTVLAFGLAFLLIWAFKHLSPAALWKWGWILILIGAIGCMITFPAMFASGMRGNFPGPGLRQGGMMMGARSAGSAVEPESASQQQEEEEAEGKALYDKLMAKEATCSDLSDNDFELIGEYLMGQRAGASHEQMNAMIKQMMGDEGEVQMHIILGKNGAGCLSGTPASAQGAGMMNGGGMMR